MKRMGRRAPARAKRRNHAVERLEGRLLLAAEYFAYNLGTLGGLAAEATDVNALGQVVGRADTAPAAGGASVQHAFVWDRGVMTDLGTLTGPAGASYGAAINDAGQVVGTSFGTSSPYTQTVFLVTPEDTTGDGRADRWFRDNNADGVNDLMRAVVNGQGYDINNAGQVVGLSVGETRIFPFRWANGVVTDLGGLSPDRYGYAYGINQAGVVVGLAGAGDGKTHAFRWTAAGGMKDLGPGTAMKVNESGVAAGYTDPVDGQAVTWAANQATPTTLGVLPGDNGGLAFDINDAGDVVGQSTFHVTDDDGNSIYRTHPFVFHAGVMRDLGALLPGAWEVLTATGISNAGQLAARYLPKGGSVGGAALLNPTDLGLPIATVGDGRVSTGANGGPAGLAFDVTLDRPSTLPVTVRYFVNAPSASAPAPLTFGPGETRKTIVVPVPGGNPLAGNGVELDVKLFQVINGALAPDTFGYGVSGRFEVPSVYPSTSWRLEAGDFDGDGRMDLVTAERQPPAARVHLNGGDGTFERLVDTATGDALIDIAVGDLNGDGKMDLAGTTTTSRVVGYYDWYDNYGQPQHTPITQSTGHVRVLLGNGDGSFTAGATADMPESHTLYEIALGDVDGDGDLDVVAAASHNETRVLLGHGDGTFAAPAAVPVAPRGEFELADVDGDGDLDLVMVEGGADGAVRVVPGNGDGTFAAPRTVLPLAYADGVAVGDVNGDGKLDVAARAQVPVFDSYGYFAYTEFRVRVLVGRGDGSFALSDSFAVGRAVGPVELADVDGDGTIDLVTHGPLELMSLRGKGDGTFSHDPDTTPTGLFFGFNDVVVRDLTGDGLADVAGLTSDALRVYFNRGNGGPPPPPPPPTMSVSDATVTEGDAGTTNAAFTVSLSAASGAPVTVQYATAGGSAVPGRDFDAAAGTLTFAPGEVTKQVLVAVRGDGVDEYDETFALDLSGAGGATVADGQAVATIIDNDAPPSIVIGDVRRREGHRGWSPTYLTVTLSAASEKPVSVNYATADGTATARGNDYITAAGTLSFAPGETTKTVMVWVVGDKKRELTERFFVNLPGATNAVLADASGEVTIEDDDFNGRLRTAWLLS
jgi:probable HAF family extracellular repeat protein